VKKYFRVWILSAAGTVLPAVSAVALFIIAFFVLILPGCRKSILERKRETIRELARSALSDVQSFAQKAREGAMSESEARAAAADHLRSLRCGPENKDYFWILTSNYRVVMHPYRRDFEGRDVADYVGPDGRNFFRDIIETVRSEGHGFVEYMWQWQDDPDRIEPKLSYAVKFDQWDWIIGTGMYIRDARREVAALTRNITLATFAIAVITSLLVALVVTRSLKSERKRREAQETLEKSEKRYRTLVETMNEGLGVRDSEWRFTYVNDRLCEILGRPRDEIIGHHVLEFVHPDNRAIMEEEIERQKSGAARRFEVAWAAPDGRKVYTLVSPRIMQDDRGRITGSIGVLVDITERREAERALRESRRMLYTLLGNLPGMAYRCLNDSEWTMEFVSRGCRDLTGYEPDDLLFNRRISYSEIIHPEDRGRVRDEVQETLRKREPFRITYRIVTAGGEVRWVWEQGVGVFSDDGELQALEGFITDITERKEAEKALALHRDQLEEMVRQRTAELSAATASLEHSLARLREDEEAGKRIQFRLFPEKRLVLDGYAFSHRLMPSMYASGDFVDYFEIDDRHVCFYMADAAGHGVSSAFATVFLKSFMSNAAENYRAGGRATILQPGALLQKLNTDLLRENLGKHLAMFYGVLNFRENRLLYAGGGQFPFPMLWHDDKVDVIEARAKPVGLFESAVFTSEEMDLPEKFTFALFSDGVLEILPVEGLREKVRRLAELVRGVVDADGAVEKLGLEDESALPDDIAVLIIRREEGSVRG